MSSMLIEKYGMKETNATKWPDNGEESLSKCPVCNSSNLKNLYKNLEDKIFFCAPGKWSMDTCNCCGSAFLNPRPTKETIYLAYKNYYTHKNDNVKKEYHSLSFLGKVKRQLANGYCNNRFGSKLCPSNNLGKMIIPLFYRSKLKLDRVYRNLPKKKDEVNQTLLDVGFGSGKFLELARSIGWEVTGVDLDEVSVKRALSRNLKVHYGDINYFSGRKELFDVITMSHVIEHTHDPICVISACYKLLKPNGILWIEAPNVNSYGHKYFGRNWLGLDTPRHLIIFNWNSIIKILNDESFSKIKKIPSSGGSESFFLASNAIRSNLDPFKERSSSLNMKWLLIYAEAISIFNKNKSEYFTITARKPE